MREKRRVRYASVHHGSDEGVPRQAARRDNDREDRHAGTRLADSGESKLVPAIDHKPGGAVNLSGLLVDDLSKVFIERLDRAGAVSLLDQPRRHDVDRDQRVAVVGEEVALLSAWPDPLKLLLAPDPLHAARQIGQLCAEALLCVPLVREAEEMPGGTVEFLGVTIAGGSPRAQGNSDLQFEGVDGAAV